jgi:hypothetical protein
MEHIERAKLYTGGATYVLNLLYVVGASENTDKVCIAHISYKKTK